MKIYEYLIIIICTIIIYIIIIKNSNKFYHNIKLIKYPNDYLVLVNKNNKLPNDYIPTDLEKINVKYSFEDKYLRKEAKQAFEKLSNDALSFGYKIIAVSAFRNYDYQENLYNNYVKNNGVKYADYCSARPGHSEHQTGLAVDIMGSNNDYNEFGSSIEFNWLKENAYKYGFILRYPSGKEKITGFKYEPWHIRYVGVSASTYIYLNNLTLEEYKKKKA